MSHSIIYCTLLQDAETALSLDKSNIRAIYQKAEALYYLGQFELSLMFFYRGLRLRPELTSFRLGVQKTQEAIEKTIGGFEKSNRARKPSKSSVQLVRDASLTSKPTQTGKQSAARSENTSNNNLSGRSALPKARPKTGKLSTEKREARKLLGELCVDKEYLENLLKHPNLKRADTGTETISALATDAIRFLNTRQEFWRQQRPCTALPHKKNLQMGDASMPKWY